MIRRGFLFAELFVRECGARSGDDSMAPRPPKSEGIPPRIIVDTMVDTIPPSAPRLYQELGHTITEWQSVEAALCNVFEKVSGCPNEKVAQAIFYAVVDFRDKLQMTHCAARQALNNEEMSKWIELRKYVVDESEVRNALAHFGVVFMMKPNDEGNAVASEMMLMPNSADPNLQLKIKRSKGPKWTKKPLSARDMLLARVRFRRLAEHLRELAGKRFFPEAPPPEPLEPHRKS